MKLYVIKHWYRPEWTDPGPMTTVEEYLVDCEIVDGLGMDCKWSKDIDEAHLFQENNGLVQGFDEAFKDSKCGRHSYQLQRISIHEIDGDSRWSKKKS